MNSIISKPKKELFIIKLSMESKWVKIVRELLYEKGSLDLSRRSVFSIVWKGIGDNDIPDIIEACQGVNNQINELDLSYNDIGAEGAKYLSAANFSNLTKLNLWNNNIGAEGVKFLTAANFPNLTGLYLESNYIGAEGANYLSTANFPNLTELNLWNNNIGAEGAKYLSASNFPNLTDLNLNENNIQQPHNTYLRLLFEQKNIENLYL